MTTGFALFVIPEVFIGNPGDFTVLWIPGQARNDDYMWNVRCSVMLPQSVRSEADVETFATALAITVLATYARDEENTWRPATNQAVALLDAKWMRIGPDNPMDWLISRLKTR